MEASKDIVSDAFEFIWANYAKIDKATAKSYLYIYVRNKSIDFLRHQNIHEQYVQIYSELTKSYVETEYLEQDERMMHISKAMEKRRLHIPGIFSKNVIFNDKK